MFSFVSQFMVYDTLWFLAIGHMYSFVSHFMVYDSWVIWFMAMGQFDFT